MRTGFTLLFLSMLMAMSAFGQKATVYYDYARNTFGDYEPLPSEKYLVINGALPSGTEFVEINVYDDDDMDDDPLATGFWDAGGTSNNREFTVPLNYRLVPGNEYTFAIRYFDKINGQEREDLYKQVRQNLQGYLNLQYKLRGDKLKLKHSARKIRGEMDQIVQRALSQYRITSPGAFDGFSDVVKQQIDALDNTKVDANTVGQAAPVQDAMDVIDGELRSIMNQDILMLRKERVLSDYEAEGKSGYFSIVGGYGGMYYSGDFDDLNYDSGWFVGLGFPFTASKVAPKIIRNGSVSMGVFVDNFKLDDGRVLTGPLVQRPVFVGLDYKLFQFIRFNAGATILELDNGDEDELEDLGNRIRVRPFVGLSAKVNLSLSIDK